MSNYKITFVAFAVMSVLNLAIVLAEIRQTHSLITIARMFSEVSLHLVIAWAFYNKWKKSEEEEARKEPFSKKN